jgi:beta-lactamase regulating signal transducer with metallopeptidase domain
MIELLMLVKVSVIIAAAALALAAVSRTTSAASRHLLCTLAIAGLLALPLLSFLLPVWSPVQWPVSSTSGDGLRVDDQPEEFAVTGPPDRRRAEGASASLAEALAEAEGGHYDGLANPVMGPPERGHYVLLSRSLLLVVYAVGVVLLTVRLLVDRFMVRRLVHDATEVIHPDWLTLFSECASEIGVRGHPRLLSSKDRATPMAVGIRRPAIVVPSAADAWPLEMRRAVLLHELAHIARRDCLTQTAAALACALYWVHPGTWWLARRLRIERELACDDLVLSAGTDAYDYAGHLLELAYTRPGPAMPALAVGMAEPRQLEARMLALLDRARNRALPTRLGRIAAIAIFAAAMVPIAAASVVAGQPADGMRQTDQSRHDLRSASLEGIARRWLSVDYWRHTATDQLSRLANEWSYLSEMRQLGYSAADVNVLFRLRQRGVTPTFVRSLAAEGLSGLSTDDLLTAANHGISAAYVRDLKELGYHPLDIEALTRLRSHGIDGEFIRELGAVGFTKLSMDDLVRSRSHGISPEYISELSSLGYQRLSLDDLILLRSHGAAEDLIRSANERAGTRLSVDQLAVLASHGWKQ